MALTTRDRRALIVGVAGLGIILGYIKAVEPMVDAYDAMDNEHTMLAAQVAQIKGEKQEAEYWTEEIEAWEARAGEMSPPKPYDEQITLVSGEVFAAAKKSGVQLKGATPAHGSAFADDPDLERASIHIDAQADWQNVFKFIAELYRINGVLSVEQIDLTGDPKKGGKLKLKLTLSVLVAAPDESGNLWAS